MVATSVLFDTNILIDCLRGILVARTEIDRYSNRAISLVTWMEVVAGVTPSDEAAVRAFLDTFLIVPVTQAIAENAVLNRRMSRMKLPDSIILATAQIQSRLLITRNTRDFPAAQSGIHVPYTL